MFSLLMSGMGTSSDFVGTEAVQGVMNHLQENGSSGYALAASFVVFTMLFWKVL